MKIELQYKEIEALKKQNISYSRDLDYSDDEAFALLDDVRSAEVFFAQGKSSQDRINASIYAKIADKVQTQI